MSGRNLESFLEDQTAFDALSEDDKARLFAGETIVGDTDAGKTAEDGSATPDATLPVVSNPTTNEPPPVSDPVVLTKDGQHAIPFSVLEAERERARQLEQEVLSLKSAKPEAATTPQATQATDPNAATPQDDLSALVRERDEAMFAGDTDKAHELSMKIISVQEQRAEERALARLEEREAKKTEQEKQQEEIDSAMARAGALVEKFPFLDPNGPTANQTAIDLVVAHRDSLMREGLSFGDAIEKAVSTVAPLFAPRETTSQGVPDVVAKAAAVIAKAQTQTPTSLSQAPAGAVVHHDQGEAIRDSDGLSLLAKFDGKSADEIMKLVSRVI